MVVFFLNILTFRTTQTHTTSLIIMENIDLIIILGYLVITLVIGLYKGRNILSVKDYAVAHRDYGTAVLVATIFGTCIGGGSTIGMVESIFSGGLIFLVLFVVTDPSSKLVMSELIAPRIGKFYEMISVGDIMGSVYGRKGKMTAGLCGFLYMSGVLGAQISTFGYIFHYFTGISPLMAIVISTGIVVCYSAFGGVRAVTATDVIQFGVIIIAIPIIANVALMEVGGYKKLFELIPEDRLVFFPSDDGISKFVFLFVAWLMPWLSPAMMQRLLMTRDVKQLKQSLRVAAMLDVPCYLVIGVIALCGMVLAPGISGKLCFPYIIDQYMTVGLKGVTIAGMLAVIMSTADSYLNAASVSLVHDFIKPMKMGGEMSDKRELFLTRLSTLLVGGIAIFSALYFKSIIDIIIEFSNIWVPLVVVPLYAAIFGFKGNERGFTIGMVGAIFVFLIFKLFSFQVGPLVPSMIVNGLCLYLFSSNRMKKIWGFGRLKELKYES